MGPNVPRLKILSVGGNAVSAFLSWRLQATQSCDVTLVWKSGFDAVSQYGISFKSSTFGNERFKPRHVVRSPEEAGASRDGAFDYVLLCVKALPDVYDLAGVIESVVTPQHTCILVNTTHTLGVEAHLEQRFPTNVVLSLVSGAELKQLGASEFEHSASSEIWVGPANKNDAIPSSIQQDMAEALAMTLNTGQVDCRVSKNIRQQQYERMIGPIAFHPASVLFETPNHAALIEKTGARDMIFGIMDELLHVAIAQDCSFPADFKDTTVAEMIKSTDTTSIMYQDFTARRPMEVETYLGSPKKLAQTVNLTVPRIETLYALLHHINVINQVRPKDVPGIPALNGQAQAMPRVSAAAAPPRANGMNGAVNSMGRGVRARTSSMGAPPPNMGGMRRGPPPMNGGPNGYPRPNVNGYMAPPPPRQMGGPQSRRGSFDNELGDEFSHLVLYDDGQDGGSLNGGEGGDLALRERELMLRQREIAIREQELRMRSAPRQRRGAPAPSIRNGGYDEDDEDGEDYFDPMAAPAPPMIDPDNFDMMSVTSKRHRKAPTNNRDIRRNPEFDHGPPARGARGAHGRPGFGRNRSSANIIASMPLDHAAITQDPMMSFADNRYATVDRTTMGAESRTNSLTAARLDAMQYGGGAPVGGPFPRRVSHSPGNPYSPQVARNGGRPSPPIGVNGGPMGRPPVGGRPSPPGGMRQPVPRHPPGQGTSTAPQQVEQHAGVSNLKPQGPVNVRSLTGSASASAGSGESATIDSENSAHSSQSSLGPRPQIGVW